MLEINSLNAFHHEPSGSNHAIRLEPDLADAEISGSAITANALVLLRRAAKTGGLKLTATGNLSRAVVEEMFGIKTPIFHPNVFPSGQICLGGRWLPTESLDLLV